MIWKSLALAAGISLITANSARALDAYHQGYDFVGSWTVINQQKLCAFLATPLSRRAFINTLRNYENAWENYQDDRSIFPRGHPPADADYNYQVNSAFGAAAGYLDVSARDMRLAAEKCGKY